MHEDLLERFGQVKKRSEDVRRFLDSENKQRQLNQLLTLIDDPGFWSDQERSTRTLQQRARLEETLNIDKKITSQLDDIQALVELAREGESVDRDLTAAIDELEAFSGKIETQVLLSGENDRNNAILDIHPGAGGTEAQDWAEMLMRMYMRWAERSGFKTQMLDYQSGDEAGIKSVTINVIGEYAYGLLASETGVHRLVRISPFDSAKRRHTSFASVAIYPELDDKIEIVIDAKELRIDTYRSSGKGGQHVNTTDSAVRITHLPTGFVTQCQNERSQHKNKEVCMKVLRARLYELEREKKKAETQSIEDSKLGIGFGSQIRSYVLQPYRMAKDLRTKVEVGDVERVL
ncbi:MAG TPA: peptide chain release factor 2, partial [Terriglobia bacterium]|nr:peptide chain release factor 2 [Terriglobia bacterium]